MRLGDLFARDADGRRRLTWRELLVYVRQLPAGSRTRLATGDSDELWGLAEHLQALTLDELRVANWQRANEGKKRSEQSRPPQPFPRPGVRRRGADKNSPQRTAKRAAALARARQRRRDINAGRIT